MSSRFWVILSAGLAIGLVVAAAIGFGLTRTAPADGIDLWWKNLMVTVRNPVATSIALFLNYVGGGIISRWIVPIFVLAALFITRKPWAAIYFLSAIVASVLPVQLLKKLVGRPRPVHALVVSDFGSFPSGHVANVVTLTVTLAIITRLAWVWVAGVIYTVAMLLSRTYLGIHWLSDTVASVLLGAAIALLLSVAFERRLTRLPLRQTVE